MDTGGTVNLSASTWNICCMFSSSCYLYSRTWSFNPFTTAPSVFVRRRCAKAFLWCSEKSQWISVMWLAYGVVLWAAVCLAICTGGWGRKTSVVQVFPILLQIRGFQTYHNTWNIPIFPPSPLLLVLPSPQEISVLGEEHTCGVILS